MSKLLQKLMHQTTWLRRRHAAHVASVTGFGGSNPGHGAGKVDAFQLMGPQLAGLMEDIHTQLDQEIRVDSEIRDLAK